MEIIETGNTTPSREFIEIPRQDYKCEIVKYI